MLPYELKDDDGHLNDLIPFIGKQVQIEKLKSRNDISEMNYSSGTVRRGELSLVDRGGGPAVFLDDGRIWGGFVTSQVKVAYEKNGNIEFKTENSVYRVSLI